MKKNALWLRFLALAMALLMTVAVFAACSTENEDVNPDTENTFASSDGSEKLLGVETDEEGRQLDDLGNDLNFDREITILGCESLKDQFWEKDDTSDNPIRVTIFKRNATVQERLGVEFKWDFENGEWGQRDEFLQKVATACETDPYDAMICYNLVPYMLAQEGLLANLYNTEHLDLSAPWWPQSMLSEILVNDTLYAVSESNEFGLLRNMMAIFFNGDMLEKRQIESPYDLVARNEWTIDKLSELVKDTYEDKNADGKVDRGDVFGFVNATNAKRDAWFFALGYKYAEVKDGEIVSLLEDDGISNYIDRMVRFYDTKDVKLYDEQQSSLFLQEQAYFYSGVVMTAESLKNIESQMHYGVVPLPKLNSQQKRYYTHLSNTYDTWCVSFNAKDLDCSSAVLECMASESYRQVGPIYFDTYVKLRYATDERMPTMYDLVRDSVTFDLIYLYSIAYPNANNPKDAVKNCITDPKANSWGSVYATNRTVWNDAFSQIVATYAKEP